MITNTNMIVLQGNIIREPEMKDDIGLLQLSVAVDYAGSERDSDNRTGYFDVKMWLNDSDRVATSTVKAIKDAYSGGRLAKGSKIALVGKIMHERWPREEGGMNSKVVIVAENLNVIWTGDKETTSDNDDTNEPVPAGAIAEPGAVFDLKDF